MYTVLLADDELPMRTYISNLIHWEAYGFRVIGLAANGRQALALYREHLPDMVIIDIRMPVIDGLSLSKEMLTDLRPPYIVLLTAYSDSRYAIEALNTGVSKYLLKHEMTADRLLSVLREAESAIGRRPRQRSKADYSSDALRPEVHSKVVADAIAIVRQEYAQNLCMGEVAARLLISASHFGYLFRKETGSSFIKHLNNVRLEQARRLLATTLLKHYEVSDLVGFDSYPHFCTIFKREIGLTPSQYRKRYNAATLDGLVDE